MSKGDDQIWFAQTFGRGQKVSIYVDLDEGFTFYPVYAGSVHHLAGMVRKPFKLEVNRALIDEYEVAARAFSAVREKFEQLYRVQEGLEPWTSSPVPAHKKLCVCECRIGECESKIIGCRMTDEIQSGEHQ